MTKQSKISILIIVAILIFTYIGIFILKQFSATTNDKANNKSTALKVQVEIAKSIDLPLEISGFGLVKSIEEVMVSSEINGLILLKSPLAYSGISLKKDDVIFEIYHKDLDLQLDNIQKSIDKFGIEKKELSIQLDQVTNELKSQREILVLSEKEYKRMETLSSGDHIPVNQSDQTKMQYLQAKIRTETLESILQSIPLKQSYIDDSIRQNQIQLLEIKEKILKATIKAPFDCMIKEVFVEAGAIASPGLKLISVYNDKIKEISVNINKKEEEIIRNCQKWDEIKLKIIGQENAFGEYHRIEGKLATSTKLLTIVFRMNELKNLIPGELVTVKIIVPINEKYYKIKKELINNGKLSLAVNQALKQIDLIPLFDLGDFYIIKENLHDGDQIITTQLPYAVDGCPLTIYEGFVPFK